MQEMELKSLEKLDRPEAERLFQKAFVKDQGLLDLENKNIGLEELNLLAEWESFPQVEKLYLSNNQLGNREIEALENLQGNVRSLYLNHNMLDDDAAHSLARSEIAKSLICLMLEANNIGPQGARALAESQHFQNLEELFLDFNPIGTEGIQALAQSDHFPNLEALHLDSTQCGDVGVMALAHSQTLTGLRRLYLCSNGIGDEGAKALSNSDNLKTLRVLSIWRNEIRDAGGEAIAESKTFGQLERLYMSLNLMEKPVRKIIRGSDLAKRLTTLVMD